MSKAETGYSWCTRYIYVNNTHDFDAQTSIKFTKKVWLYFPVIYKKLIYLLRDKITYYDPVHEYHANQPTQTGCYVENTFKGTFGLKVNKYNLTTYEYEGYPNYYVTNNFFIYKDNFSLTTLLKSLKQKWRRSYKVHAVNFDDKDIIQMLSTITDKDGKVVDKVFDLSKIDNFYIFNEDSNFIFKDYNILSAKLNGTFQVFTFKSTLDLYVIVVKIKNKNIYHETYPLREPKLNM
jgi:hypothetical protein